MSVITFQLTALQLGCVTTELSKLLLMVIIIQRRISSFIPSHFFPHFIYLSFPLSFLPAESFPRSATDITGSFPYHRNLANQFYSYRPPHIISVIMLNPSLTHLDEEGSERVGEETVCSVLVF